MVTRDLVTTLNPSEVNAGSFLSDLDVRALGQRSLVDDRVHKGVRQVLVVEPSLREDVVDVHFIVEVGRQLNCVAGPEVLGSMRSQDALIPSMACSPPLGRVATYPKE
jgi:hypothetical protein